ncbi:SBBP repeat-containing protein [Variovorax sp. J22R133]|uniref:SBBP repeat-containing protein n=1 Tax=Variovorax brevis TaxID=3053503 RepID=UPI00257500B8|nr:SBBP repeat-containing protein [Variovorax sp. J22R133]MDM0110720.1 SBBP repeat-containing protein [Variovorax sp. J22R133]
MAKSMLPGALSMGRLRWLGWVALLLMPLLLAACGGSHHPHPRGTSPSITDQPTSVTVTVGQRAKFEVTAAGSGPLAYQWRKNGADIAGATDFSYTTPATTTADNGALFVVVVSNALGSVTSNAATLTVGPVAVAPVITTQPAAISVVAGQSAAFSVVASGTAPLAYQWRKNGAAIAGATSVSYSIPATAIADSGGLYSVVVTNTAGSATSGDALLSVTSTPVAPTVTTEPGDATVNEGQTATFTVLAAGTAPLAYEWRKNGTPIAGANLASYTTAATVAADSGSTFSVQITNAAGGAASRAAILTVTAAPVPPAIVTPPASVTVTAGQAANFTVTASGTAPSYQWLRNGTPIVGANSATYVLATTSVADNGAAFSVTVSNAVSSVTSPTATLNVLPAWTGIRQAGAPFPSDPVTSPISSANAVATDPQGNVVIGGYTTGVFTDVADAGATKPFVAKYSASGSLLWQRQVLDVAGNTSVFEAVNGVAVDGGGNIYVTGQTLTVVAGETPVAGTDVFVAKFAPNGDRLWVHLLGSSENDVGNGVAVDAAGNAFVVGSTAGALPGQAAPVGFTDYFIAKYNTAGVRSWVLQGQFKTTAQAAEPLTFHEAHGVAVDAAGNAYLAGWTQSSPSGRNGAYAAKFDTNSVLQWQTQLGGETLATNLGLPVRGDAIAVSADGSKVYLSGHTNADFDVSGTPAVSPNLAQGDAFVAAFNGTGVRQWVHNLSSETVGADFFDDEAFGVATNADGSAVFITGFTGGTLPGETSKGGEDMFAARYDAAGTRQWVKQYGPTLPATSTRNDRGLGITLDLHGDVFVCGTTIGTFGTPGRTTDRNDWFVLKMKPADGSLY